MRKTLIVFLLTIITISLNSCASNLSSISKDVYLVDSDKFNSPGTKIYVSTNVDIPRKLFSKTILTMFNLRYEQTENGSAWLIVSKYAADEWLFVSQIKLLVNKNVYQFQSMPGPFRKVGYPLGGSNIYEQNNFIITPEFCKAILSANQMSVRIIGENTYIDDDLNNDDIQSLKNFIAYINSNVSRTKLN